MANRICTVPACGRPRNGRLYCKTHENRCKKYGDPLADEPIKDRRTDCSVQGCDGEHLARGLCGKHLRRLYVTGDVGPAGDLPRPRRRDCTRDGCHAEREFNSVHCPAHIAAIAEKRAFQASPIETRMREIGWHVNELTECWEWNGTRSADGYGVLRDGNEIYTHRHAYLIAYGDLPAGFVVRHACDNPPCCNPLHLSLGTQQDNSDDNKRRRRTTSFRDGWASVCRAGLHDITKPGALRTYTSRVTGHTYQTCSECRRISSARATAARAKSGSKEF